MHPQSHIKITTNTIEPVLEGESYEIFINGIRSPKTKKYECKYLKYKFKLFHGIEGLKLGQRPMIDIKSILVIKNHGKFKGSALSVGKTGEASNMSSSYYHKEFDRIEEYIIRWEATNFTNAYCILKSVIPEIKIPSSIPRQETEWSSLSNR